MALQRLSVENLALVTKAELEFAPGFVGVTGETGAGKSVLLGALKLLAGARTGRSVVHPDAQQCRVSACLAVEEEHPIHGLLEELGLPACEEGLLLLRRIIPKAGKGTSAFINGDQVTITTLQRLGALWIDFHGAGESQKLLREDYALALLDRYADTGDLLGRYQESYRAWKALLTELQAVEQEQHLSPEEQAFYRVQLEQIEKAAPSAEIIEALEVDYQRFEHAQELRDLSNTVALGLTAGQTAALSSLNDAFQAAEKWAEMDPEVETLKTRLQGLLLEVGDLGQEFAALSQNIALNRQEIEVLQQRMNAWLEVRHKFGGSIEAVLAYRQRLEDKLEGQNTIKERLEDLNKKASEVEQEAENLAKELFERRSAAGHQLGKECTPLLRDLGFKQAHLSIECLKTRTLGVHGDCSCNFLFASNPGQAPLPFNQIASSGEVARVLLALKSVLAECDQTPVLVFDEVDANVGGEIGVAVGEALTRLARGRQLFCITHLPQVAALADQHYCVSKYSLGAGIRTDILPLHFDSNARKKELARMLGDRSSDSALHHAEHLLQSNA